MTYFSNVGNAFVISDAVAKILSDHLPTGNYVLKIDQVGQYGPPGGLYLAPVNSFKRLSKYYGDCLKWADRIISTFEDRQKSTGVMLTGEKGSGKTLLAKELSIICAEKNIPTIIVDSEIPGVLLNKFIGDIDQPMMILFDEFEKIYADAKAQESILTLLDGVFSSMKLFILTCNDKWKVDSHFRNRPGRIFYMIDYKGLEEAFIREYCEDKLQNKSHIGDVCKVASFYQNFNFDMLQALVSEMNRYSETAFEATEILNVKVEYESYVSTHLTVKITDTNGEVVDSSKHWPREIAVNPLQQKHVDVEVYARDDDDEGKTHRFFQSDMIKFNATSKIYTYKNADGWELELSKRPEGNFDYHRLAI